MKSCQTPKHIIAVLLLLIFCSGCVGSHATLHEIPKHQDIHHVSYWGKAWRNCQVTTRIYQATDKLVLAIAEENKRDGFSERPVAAKPIPEFSLAMTELMNKMPPNLKAILDQRLIGIFCLKGLGSSGYTEVVFDESGQEAYGIIVLDVDILLKRRANDWSTWKEGSYFNNRKGIIAPKLLIEEPQNDTIINAIRYIMLHEFGHVLGAVTKAHPSWLTWQKEGKIDFSHQFSALSWQQDAQGNIVSLFDDRYSARKLLRAYSFENSALPAEKFRQVYDDLTQTNFPNLTAAQNPWEDFSESFATYFHTVIDNRPWQIVIDSKTHQEVILGHCWNEDRCRRKKELLQTWIDDPYSLAPSSIINPANFPEKQL